MPPVLLVNPDLKAKSFEEETIIQGLSELFDRGAWGPGHAPPNLNPVEPSHGLPQKAKPFSIRIDAAELQQRLIAERVSLHVHVDRPRSEQLRRNQIARAVRNISPKNRVAHPDNAGREKYRVCDRVRVIRPVNGHNRPSGQRDGSITGEGCFCEVGKQSPSYGSVVILVKV